MSKQTVFSCIKKIKPKTNEDFKIVRALSWLSLQKLFLRDSSI